MKPEGKRCAIIEDALEWQSQIKSALTEGGHTVVARATNLQAALDLVKNLKKLKVQVVTLDGNLTPDADNGNHGREVLQCIRATAPKVKVVGMSLDSMPRVDVDVGKQGIRTLAYEVSKLK
ncbi:MAG: response regulator [Patescibacteria group bacterium]